MEKNLKTARQITEKFSMKVSRQEILRHLDEAGLHARSPATKFFH